jgi:hypothetical protein
MAEMKPLIGLQALKLGDGSVLRHGQIIKAVGAHNRTAELSATPGYSDPLANGAAKNTPIPAPAHGMRKRTDGHNLAFEGGRRPLQDEPLQKAVICGKSAPIHNGMRTNTPEHRGTDKGPYHGSDVLRAAVLKK